ncbi:MAG: ATP-dependent DNA helicase PcrA, partial [Anaerolineae bacterium]|nr:ATP-dependent DNA helicase PcrA [Anaerolineae bacterium]
NSLEKSKPSPQPAPRSVPQAAKRPQLTQPTFRPGETVIHPTFGPGTVVSSKIVGDDEEVTVAFENQGVKRLLASFAKLQRG